MRPNAVKKQSVQYRVWNKQQCAEVANAVFRVLERTGCLIQNKEARHLLKEAGCFLSGERVKIPQTLMRWAIDSAPSAITFYDRFGKPAMKLGPYEVNFGPVIGDTFILDIETGEKRRGLKTDAVNAGLVCDALPNLAWSSAVALVSDCEPQLADIYEIRHLLPHTTKPVMCWSHSTKNLIDILEMFEVVAGSPENLVERPMGICLICPVDPLIHTDNGLSQIIYASKKRFPIVYIAGVSFGCIGPITLAGSIVVGMADTLVGLLISQLTTKGTPFVVSKFSDNLDMKTGTISHSRPELLLANAASADLFRYLDLPFCLNYGGTDTGALNEQYLFDIAINYHHGYLSGTNMNFALGALEGGNSSCLECLVLGDEVISYVGHLIDGIEVSDYTLAEDLIHKVGPGGNFLAEKQTSRHVRDFWEPSFLVGQSHEKWTAGKRRIGNQLRERVKKIIKQGPQNPLDRRTIKELDVIVERAEKQINS